LSLGDNVNKKNAKLLSALLVVALVAGCASDPAKREVVARSQAERLPSTSENLSGFGRFEMAKTTLTPEIQGDPKKAQAAIAVELAVQQRVQPLLTEWNSRRAGSTSRSLLIEPRIVELYIPSGNSRFWAGAFAGESVIDLQLKLTEKETGAAVGQVDIRRTASAMAGAWSIGKSDKNLMLYIADIAHQYLENNYKPSP
jgi:hypothetical protein